MIVNRRTIDVNVRQEGAKVLVNWGGRFFAELEPEAAERIARAMISVAKLADEWKQAERIAGDSAILMRAGVPFTLSRHPRILDAARNEAAWNPTLRRFMPGGVKSTEVFGTPVITQDPPKGNAP